MIWISRLRKPMMFVFLVATCPGLTTLKTSHTSFMVGSTKEYPTSSIVPGTPPFGPPAWSIFGAVHCCGWLFAFLTIQKLLLWRIGSVLTTITPIATLGLVYLNFNLSGAVPTLIAFHIISWLFIVVEVFQSLFFLTPDAFISAWVDNVSHVP